MSYIIQIQTDDGNGGTFKKQFTLNLNKINKNQEGSAIANSNATEDTPFSK